jgi:hypothetical protein
MMRIDPPSTVITSRQIASPRPVPPVRRARDRSMRKKGIAPVAHSSRALFSADPLSQPAWWQGRLGKGGGSRSTPTVDVNRLYVLTENGDLACLGMTPEGYFETGHFEIPDKGLPQLVAPGDQQWAPVYVRNQHIVKVYNVKAPTTPGTSLVYRHCGAAPVMIPPGTRADPEFRRNLPSGRETEKIGSDRG